MAKPKLKPGKYFSKADKETRVKLSNSLRIEASKMAAESDEKYRKAANDIFLLRLLR